MKTVITSIPLQYCTYITLLSTS